MQELFEKYLEYYENLTPETVVDLRQLAAPDLHFVDPFSDVRDVEQVLAILSKMLHSLDEPSFRVLDYSVSGRILYAHWEFGFGRRFFRGGRRQTIFGMSRVLADERGRILEHLDFWDASTALYQHLPLVGLPIRLVRRLLG